MPPFPAEWWLTAAPWLVAATVAAAGLTPGGASGTRARRLLSLSGPRESGPRESGPRVGPPGGDGPARRLLTRWRRPTGGPSATDLAASVTELAGLVRAGVPPATAWGYAATGVRSDAVGAAVRVAADAAAAGASVADALQSHAGSAPGDVAADLRCVAASWRLVERTGAPVADVLDRVAQTVRDRADGRAARATAMAAPRATARVLAVLPLVGLGLGQLMGTSAVQVLVGTPLGRLSAAVGLAFAVAGAVWTRRLMQSAGRSG